MTAPDKSAGSRPSAAVRTLTRSVRSMLDSISELAAVAACFRFLVGRDTRHGYRNTSGHLCRYRISVSRHHRIVLATPEISLATHRGTSDETGFRCRDTTDRVSRHLQLVSRHVGRGIARPDFSLATPGDGIATRRRRSRDTLRAYRDTSRTSRDTLRTSRDTSRTSRDTDDQAIGSWVGRSSAQRFTGKAPGNRCAVPRPTLRGIRSPPPGAAQISRDWQDRSEEKKAA